MKNLRKRRVIKLTLKRDTDIEQRNSAQESMGVMFKKTYNKQNEICIDLSSLVLSTASIKSSQRVEETTRSRHSHIVSRSGVHCATFF